MGVQFTPPEELLSERNNGVRTIPFIHVTELLFSYYYPLGVVFRVVWPVYIVERAYGQVLH